MGDALWQQRGRACGCCHGRVAERDIDLAFEEVDELEDDDLLMRHDAEFVLSSELVLGLLKAFKKQLGGYVRV